MAKGLMAMTTSRGDTRIITIDCNYLAPRFAASYLIIDGDHGAFIECNTNRAVPRLLRALEENGLGREQVELIAVTHVHLDHSGGAGLLAKECPNATVVAHKKAAKHLVSPERLVQGATAVYGKSRFKELYGSVDPVDESRVRIVEDGEKVSFGARTLESIYTAGHAWHHMCLYDSLSNSIFTGDAFGLGYPLLGKPLLFPSSSPASFHAEEAQKSVDRILATGAETAYLTHFGAYTDLPRHARALKKRIDKIEAIRLAAIESQLHGEELDRFCLKRMDRFFKDELNAEGIEFSPENERLLQMDIELNAQGIALVAR
jgi:glyoxylase-like metal-dependent hydrolase (beta-lactamase superfamily II)